MREISTYAQVLESIREHGQILPVYIWQGNVLDGAKRQQACLETAREPTYQTIHEEHLAASLLWSLHPERALETFGQDRTFSDLVVLFNARPTTLRALMHERDARRPQKPKATPKRRYGFGMLVRLPEDAQRIVYATSSSLRVHRTEVVIAALRAATPEALERELRALRKR